jgi:hypothetical protein
MQMTNERSQRCGGVGHIHEHEPTDQRIEREVGGECVEFRNLEPNVSHSHSIRTPTRDDYRLRTAIDTKQQTRRPNQVGGKQRHITTPQPISSTRMPDAKPAQRRTASVASR